MKWIWRATIPVDRRRTMETANWKTTRAFRTQAAAEIGPPELFRIKLVRY